LVLKLEIGISSKAQHIGGLGDRSAPAVSVLVPHDPAASTVGTIYAGLHAQVATNDWFAEGMTRIMPLRRNFLYVVT
jgi:hypothetical protein